jgi:CRP/FNR family cyclic AMP-dependent transcriptional regulator
VLDRACRDLQTAAQLEFEVTQQDLADAIGSVRDVVAWAMSELRKKRLIETGRRRIRVLDARRLEDFALSVLNAT